MAHELTIRADGRVEMAFRKGTQLPWHFSETNPQQVPANATTDQWVHAAGMEWTAQPAPITYTVDGETFGFDRKILLHRSDNKAALGVVSPDYKIFQPRECVEFFDDLAHTVGLKLDTAGTMFGGRRFWALAKIDEAALIDKLDVHKGYLLLTTSLDGTTSTEARFTDVRVVCNNTLSIAMAGTAAHSVKITHRMVFDADEVKRQLGVAPASFEDFMDKMRKLADRRVDDDEAVELVKATTKTDTGKSFTSTMELFRGLATGNSLPGSAGTAYGLLNAFTETLDHKSTSRSDSHLFNSILLGPASIQKAQFRDSLLDLVA